MTFQGGGDGSTARSGKMSRRASQRAKGECKGGKMHEDVGGRVVMEDGGGESALALHGKGSCSAKGGCARASAHDVVVA